MKTTIQSGRKYYQCDLSQPIDISIPLREGSNNVNAWYCDPVKIEPVVMGDWIGDVNKGAGVNFRNIFLNPHGNGTHTECVGHISKEKYSLNQLHKQFFFFAELITVTPEKQNDDLVITEQMLKKACKFENTDALIIRTNPNSSEKRIHQYSNTNPPYLSESAAGFIVSRGIKHLLIDLPSIDREKDEGKLSAHHEFWQYPENPRFDCTITELIYVPNEIADDMFLLNIQITSLENDASPSKPVLYKLSEQ